MNLLHLKYAVEVEKTRSINKAAENLFMGQPNLSRSIKDLEESMGIVIFKRTSRGMEPTDVGEEFLAYAKKILLEVELVENIYKGDDADKLKFSISLPRACYVSCAFDNFLARVDTSKSIDFNYKETNAMRVIKNVEVDGFKLGILRYRTEYEQYFKSLISEKGLEMRELFEFNYKLIMSKDCPLNKIDNIKLNELGNYIEVLHGDPYVPNMSTAEAKKSEFSGITNKNIYLYERASQYPLLEKITDAYMWVSPTPRLILDKYNLVQRNCNEYNKLYKDVLIYKKNYRFTDLDNIFLEEVEKFKEIIISESQSK